ncbi:hypothetical protein [Capnocytophaga sp. oral taxon 878]|uniref:hypothetical protein n=1 Tax=Capnocytophaga sp. oral taxon 878 TaxID=1316596 RepID=UPI000D030EBC|nr:hypothetical protein [Capnocytophaga sp. oral taxon 878]AVM50682.1 hypothetical protein C4H12_09475 [Capnocytophaga sp. oral taxon 878]
MDNFKHWKESQQKQQLAVFNTDSSALLWLKIKSILRKELLSKFLSLYHIDLKHTTLSLQFEELFNLLEQDIPKSHAMLDSFIKQISYKQIKDSNQEQLISELYKLNYFQWGGDYQNSLDKYLISKYVKVKQPSYQELLSKFDTEINTTVQNYVLSSWYNHWSSILIENIFKQHPIVLPTIGQIKNVDFIINNIPFDLKVTYFPNEYMKQKRKEIGLPSELTFLKNKAAELGIFFDKKAKPATIQYEIIEKLKDRNDTSSIAILKQLEKERLSVIAQAQLNPKLLIQWLYENQGEMRFGAENRLFLILVDTDDFENSWKLKRNINILQPAIHQYLDSFSKKETHSLKIEFTYKNNIQKYTALADCIFIVK